MRYKAFLSLVAVFATLVAAVGGADARSANSEILFHEDFETDVSEWLDGGLSDICCDHSVQLVNDVARVGSQSARFEHRLGDPIVNNGNRAELSRPPVDLEPDGEYWFAVSILLPDDYQFETVSGHWQVAYQIHAYPDFDLGENWRSPPFGVYLKGDQWQINVRSSPDPVNTNQSAEHLTWLFPAETGVWTDWAFHINFSYGSDGFVHMYKDQQLIESHEGPTYYNDQTGPYVKTGIYRAPNSEVPIQVQYVDEVRIGTANAGLAAMSPVDDPVTDPATLAGTVTRSGGSGVAGVAAELRQGGADGALVASTTTSADGSYLFEADPGCYAVVLTASRGDKFTNGSKRLTLDRCVTAGEVADDLDGVLRARKGR